MEGDNSRLAEKHLGILSSVVEAPKPRPMTDKLKESFGRTNELFTDDLKAALAENGINTIEELNKWASRVVVSYCENHDLPVAAKLPHELVAVTDDKSNPDTFIVDTMSWAKRRSFANGLLSALDQDNVPQVKVEKNSLPAEFNQTEVRKYLMSNMSSAELIAFATDLQNEWGVTDNSVVETTQRGSTIETRALNLVDFVKRRLREKMFLESCKKREERIGESLV